MVIAASFPRLALRSVLPCAVLVLCLWAMAPHLRAVAPQQIIESFRAIAPLNWVVAAVACAISFWAIGHYDLVAHRHFQTQVPRRAAVWSGTAAIALAQTLGFGVLTGGLVRFRLLGGLGPKLALMISGFVSLSFMTALGMWTALACLMLPAPDWAAGPACMILALGVLFFAVVLWAPPLGLRGRVLALPSLPAFLALLGWGLIDLLAAALALYLLLPPGALPFAVFLPVFLLALGAALISGTPSGLGPFELTLLTLLGQSTATGAMPAAAPLLAGIAAFRVLYFFVPAGAALIGLMRPLAPITPLPPPAQRPAAPQSAGHLRAETQVLRQSSGATVLLDGRPAALWQHRHSLSVFLDAPQLLPKSALEDLHQMARGMNKCACLYKVGPRQAAVARQVGWTCLHIADEALIDPLRFDIKHPHCRSLRRKLRKARKAGIAIAPASPADLAGLDAQWIAARGRARGGSTGRFDPDYLKCQQVFCAFVDATPCAFVSFHHSETEWCLDLIRFAPQAADGAVQTLIIHAIAQARSQGVARLSLAAAPATRLCWAKPCGLRRFKSAFAPSWHPRYLAAPQPFAMTLAASDIARAVFLPARLGPDRPRPPGLPCHHLLHDNDENYEFASPSPL